MAHPFSNRPVFLGYNDSTFGFGDGGILGEDEDARVSAFCRNLPASRAGATLWSEYATLQEEVFEVLAHGSADQRRQVYTDLYATSLTHGFAQGHVVYGSLMRGMDAKAHVGVLALDRLFRLAEAVGATTVKSAEHGQTTIDVGDLDALFNYIETCVGFDLTPPVQDGKLFGIRLKRGIISDRHCDGIYGAWRARETLLAQGRSFDRVVEIGGGAGHLAYYARKTGCLRYTIIDLPQAMTVQYILLSAAFGADTVALATQGVDGISLLAADDPAAESFVGSELVINVDSLPEIPSTEAASYIGRVPSGAILLSINQESGVANGLGRQNVVSELAHAAGLKRVVRHPAWLRTGYVEEVFTRK